MSVMHILDQVRGLGIDLWVEEGDRLRFRAEKGVMTPALKQQIIERRTEIITVVKQMTLTSISAPAIGPAPSDALLPLSFAQERLWFYDRFQPQSSVYLIPKGLILRGPVDVRLLGRAMTAVVAAQHSLRTAFADREGTPYQVVMPLTWALPLLDLSAMGSQQQEALVQNLAARCFGRPFNLEKAPLFRALLIRRAASEHVLLLSIHHMIADDWSLGIFVRALTQTYASAVRGQAAELRPPALQYTDYAYHQRSKNRDLSPLIAYWQNQLRDLPTLHLPYDHARPAKQTYGGATHGFLIAPALLQSLKDLAQTQNASLYMVLLAAFNLLLFRCSSQTDLAICSSVGNRNQPELEEIIGLFVNLVIMRNRLSADLRFSEFLQQVRTNTLAAFEHADAPFEKVVEACAPTRDLSRHPLAQVQMIFTTAPKTAVAVGAMEVLPFAAQSTVAKMDLTLGFNETSRGLLAGIEYNTDLFEAATIVRLADQLNAILTRVSERGDAFIFELLELSQADRITWDELNGTDTNYPRELTLNEVFQEQLALRPHAPALRAESQTYAYQELHREANKVCKHLRSFGIGPGSRVGLCLPSGPEAIISILAIVKAGAAYVPLDPKYPMERLGFILNDAAISALIANEHTIDQLPVSELHFLVAMVYEEFSDLPEVEETEIADVSCPLSEAYVIYTSGSTGNPKGVVVCHRNIVRLVKQTNYLDFSPDNIWLQASSLSFDASTLEIWGALLNGASLAFFAGQSLELLGEQLRRHRVNTLWLTAQLFHVMVDEFLADLAGITQLLAGGDMLSLKHVKAFLSAYPNAHLINGYGPTESTTFTCCCDLSQRGLLDTSVAIGTPIANTQVQILDAMDNLVPVGVVGELCIGGDGLAHGYLNQPAYTAQKFVANPLGLAQGERLYRTGDQARLRADGLIEFLGRRDNQVKIRGFRIELDEITAALNQCPGVREAVVCIAQEEQHKTLIAYLVPEHEAPSVAELRLALTQRLPDYMIPSSFVALEALPVTSQGKIDRHALVRLNPIAASKELRLPTNPIEQILADIWCATFAREQVGLDDSFFELGGDSLLSLKILAKAAHQGLHFELQKIFEHPTIGKLAPFCRLQGQETVGYSPFALISNEDRACLPLEVEDAFPPGHLQLGMLFHSAFAVDSPLYHDILYYHLEMPFRQTAVRNALDALSAQHQALRLSFELDRFSAPLQLIYSTAQIPLHIFDLGDRPDWQAAFDTWLAQEKCKPFNWRTPPLFEVFIHQLPSGFRCSFSFHHAILDGWSEATLFMAFLKELLGAGSTPGTSPKLQLGRFIQLEQQAVSSEQTQQFWQALLSNCPTTRLCGQAAPAEPTKGTQLRRAVTLSEERSNQLHALAQQLKLPLKSVLMAAHFRVLALLSGSRDVITGVISNGRPEEEGAELLLGLFLNTLPYRIKIISETWKAFIARVLQLETQIMPHRRYPLPLLMKQQGGRTLFETHFNFTHFHMLNRLEGTGAAQVVRGRGGATENSMDLVMDFSINPGSNQILASLGYNSARYCEDRIELICASYAHVLTDMTCQPEANILDRNLLLPEHIALLEAWNQTSRDHAQAPTLTEAFQRLTAAEPQRLAIAMGSASYSRDCLNRASNRLARMLLKQGVRPGSAVGLFMDRDVFLVVAMLAVVKTGAFYIPFNVQEAPERLQNMIEDADVALVMVGPELTLPVSAAQILRLHRGADVSRIFLEEPEHNLSVAPPAQATAYCIYTSGSTGQPKGVCISHASLMNFTAEVSRRYHLGPEDRVLQFCAAIFDMSVKEIHGTLLSDGLLIMNPKLHDFSPWELNQFIATSGITILIMPAAYWHTWVGTFDENAPPHFPNLRLINAGGEQSGKATLEKWSELSAGPVIWINTYGPTETTVVATMFEVGQGLIREKIPMGRPLANVRLHVLDDCDQPVPIGVPGILHIAGAGLASGYLKRPARTAAVFLPDPFAAQPGERRYDSGDLVYFQTDGNLVFMGRRDHQIKLRGFRIETGEIEACLTRLPSVQAAAVSLREDGLGAASLVAFVVADPFQEEELLAHLRRQLPAYMIPGRIVKLDALPLSPGGKINRRQLPDIETAPVRQAVAPRTLMEHRLAVFWSEVLGAKDVYIDDDFFQLGGTSLSALQLMSRIERFLGKPCPIITLFQFPVLADLARHLEVKTTATVLVPMRTGTSPNWFAMHPVGGDVHWYFPLAAALARHGSFYGLQAHGEDLSLKGDLHDVVRTYVDRIKAQQNSGPYRLLGWSVGGSIALEAALQLEAQGAEVSHLVLIDAVRLPAVHLPPIAQRLKTFVVDRLGYIPEGMDTLTPDLTEESALSQVHSMLKRLGYIQEGDDEQTLARLFKVYDFFHRHAQGYQPSGIYSGKASLIVTADTQARRVKQQWGDLDASFGWQPFLEHPLQTVSVTGDHNSVLRNPQLSEWMPHMIAYSQES